MPVVRLEQHKSIEAHWDGHRVFPFRAIERVLIENVVLEGFVAGIADRLQASLVHGDAIRLRALVPEKLGPALAVLWAAQVENAGPMALVDMNARLLVVAREGYAARTMREVVGPGRPNGFSDQR